MNRSVSKVLLSMWVCTSDTLVPLLNRVDDSLRSNERYGVVKV